MSPAGGDCQPLSAKSEFMPERRGQGLSWRDFCQSLERNLGRGFSSRGAAPTPHIPALKALQPWFRPLQVSSPGASAWVSASVPRSWSYTTLLQDLPLVLSTGAVTTLRLCCLSHCPSRHFSEAQPRRRCPGCPQPFLQQRPGLQQDLNRVRLSGPDHCGSVTHAGGGTVFPPHTAISLLLCHFSVPALAQPPPILSCHMHRF